jgi:MFS family permease
MIRCFRVFFVSANNIYVIITQATDMSIETPAPEEKPLRRLFLPSLIVAISSVNASNSIIALLASDIAKTFFGSSNPANVAAVGQLSTVNAAAEVVFALLLSVLVIRFRYKPLLLVGVIFVVVSAVGSFFAPTLLSLQLFYAAEGIGSVMVTVLAFTLIGDSLSADKKTKAISYVRSVGPAIGLVGALLVVFIADFGGWRSDFLFFALPFSAGGLILASFALPS